MGISLTLSLPFQPLTNVSLVLEKIHDTSLQHSHTVSTLQPDKLNGTIAL